jgi:hypothetical protein
VGVIARQRRRVGEDIATERTGELRAQRVEGVAWTR